MMSERKEAACPLAQEAAAIPGMTRAPAASSPSYQVRELTEADGPAVRQLFHEVFGKPMSEGLWRWKYAGPAGHGVGVFQADELVAHYGGMGRDMRYFGEPARTVQITDVMVKPAARKSVRRHSPFFLAVKAFSERYTGYRLPYLLGYGFPSDRHMQLAEHLGLYAPVARIVECSWPARPARRSLNLRLQAINRDNFSRVAPRLNLLWQGLATDLDGHVCGVKDAAWLRRRYLEHPDLRYQLVLVERRLPRKALGLLVLREEGDHLLLLDIIAPLRQFPCLIHTAAGLAAQAGKPWLKAWCAEGFVEHFRHGKCITSPQPIRIPTCVWTEGPNPEGLRDHWWLMAGDTDFL